MIRLRHFSQLSISKSYICLNKNEKLMLEVKPLLMVMTGNVDRLSYSHTKTLFVENISFRPPLELKHFSSKKKSNKRHRPAEEEEEGSSDEDDKDEELDNIYSDMKTFSTKSLRVDVILQKALGLSRTKIHGYLYENRLRKNGMLVLKKAAETGLGDELDIIKDVSNENANTLTVTRVIIVDVKPDHEKQSLVVKADISKSLTIQNYDGRNKYRKQSEPEES